jgi:hypothetical protein
MQNCISVSPSVHTPKLTSTYFFEYVYEVNLRTVQSDQNDTFKRLQQVLNLNMHKEKPNNYELLFVRNIEHAYIDTFFPKLVN